jgi:hypothetical protein
MQLKDMGWHLSFVGVVKCLVAWLPGCLVAWFVAARMAGWLLAAIYNRLQ